MSILIYLGDADPGSGTPTLAVSVSGYGPGYIYQVDPNVAIGSVAVSVSGTGLLNGESAPEIHVTIGPQDSENPVEGLSGFVGDGTQSVAISFDSGASNGTFGDIGSGSVSVSVLISGSGWENATGSSTLNVTIGIPQSYDYTGHIGSGSADVVVSVSGSGEHSVSFVGSSNISVRVGIEQSPLDSISSDDGFGQWAVFPLTMPTAAVSQHSTAFSSMVTVGGKTYATTSSGIVELGHRDDDGTAISSEIARREEDFGTNLVKRASDVYIGLQSEGNLTITIESESGNGTVTLSDNIPSQHGSKVNLPRGVSGRHWNLALRNVSGADFEISDMEFALAISETRRGRQT